MPPLTRIEVTRIDVTQSPNIDWQRHVGATVEVMRDTDRPSRQDVVAAESLHSVERSRATEMRALSRLHGVEVASMSVRMAGHVYTSRHILGEPNSVSAQHFSTLLSAALMRAHDDHGSFAQLRSVDLWHTHPDVSPLSPEDVGIFHDNYKYLTRHGVAAPGTAINSWVVPVPEGSPLFRRQRIAQQADRHYLSFAESLPHLRSHFEPEPVAKHGLSATFCARSPLR